MLAGDAELLEPQRAGLEEPLEVASHRLLHLRGVRFHPLPDPVEELHHADLGLVGLGVEGSRRSSGAGEEAARCARESHGGERSWRETRRRRRGLMGRRVM